MNEENQKMDEQQTNTVNAQMPDNEQSQSAHNLGTQTTQSVSNLTNDQHTIVNNIPNNQSKKKLGPIRNILVNVNILVNIICIIFLIISGILVLAAASLFASITVTSSPNMLNGFALIGFSLLIDTGVAITYIINIMINNKK